MPLHHCPTLVCARPRYLAVSASALANLPSISAYDSLRGAAGALPPRLRPAATGEPRRLAAIAAVAMDSESRVGVEVVRPECVAAFNVRLPSGKSSPSSEAALELELDELELALRVLRRGGRPERKQVRTRQQNKLEQAMLPSDALRAGLDCLRGGRPSLGAEGSEALASGSELRRLPWKRSVLTRGDKL